MKMEMLSNWFRLVSYVNVAFRLSYFQAYNFKTVRIYPVNMKKSDYRELRGFTLSAVSVEITPSTLVDYGIANLRWYPCSRNHNLINCSRDLKQHGNS